MRNPIQSVEVSYLIHETEDAEKIGRAVLGVFASASEPTIERLEGHHGNGILRATVHLLGEDAARAFDEMVKKMPGAVKAEVMAQLGSFIDQHSALFLRFDKQRLVSGSLALGSGDSVRVKLKPRAFMIKGGAERFYGGFFGG